MYTQKVLSVQTVLFVLLRQRPHAIMAIDFPITSDRPLELTKLGSGHGWQSILRIISRWLLFYRKEFLVGIFSGGLRSFFFVGRNFARQKWSGLYLEETLRLKNLWRTSQ